MTRRSADRLNGIARKIRDALVGLLALVRGTCWQIMGGVPLRYDEDVKTAIGHDGGEAALGCGKGKDG